MNGPWRCNLPGTFAWHTCTERWPRIVRGLADDVPAHRAALMSLAREIEGGGVTPLWGPDDDFRFDVIHDYSGRPWTSLPWYVGESWLYAKVRAAVGWRFHGRDPFRAAKAREEAGLVDGENPADPDPLASALWRSLWGNRADLSLPSAKDHTATRQSDLLADERPQALAWLRSARRVVILADNAGTELFADLQLARVLEDGGARVTLLVKDAPFFVSDAIPDDVARARRHLGRDVAVKVVAHPFLTGPDWLATPFLPAPLRDLLGTADVIVAKGDCNYRRLVGDQPWDPEYRWGFADVVDLPAPVIALRTLKAEVLVGVDAASCARARDLADDWLVSGRFGVVQCAPGR
jgi:uncharacterized protein with ATP-grasp and redox domains